MSCKHSFDVDLAKKYGVYQAVVLNLVWDWMYDNFGKIYKLRSEINLTINELEKLIPYMRKEEIVKHIQSLCEVFDIKTEEKTENEQIESLIFFLLTNDLK